jgi:hypothetical protein
MVSLNQYDSGECHSRRRTAIGSMRMARVAGLFGGPIDNRPQLDKLPHKAA